MRFCIALTLAAAVLAGCAQLSAAIANAPADPNCIPGSVTKPCR
jgi:hypothetical protein